jgi:hypothetical protein
MLINDKEVKLKLDLGALKMVQQQTGKNFFALKEGDFDPEMYAALIYACAKRGGAEITQEEIEDLPLPELMSAQSELDELMQGIGGGNKKAKNRAPRS